MTLFLRKFYFTPGDLGFKTIPTKKRKNRNFVCWDQWYPEAALDCTSGAEVLYQQQSDGIQPKRRIW
jgi:N-carbamoylputrescine amidase